MKTGLVPSLTGFKQSLLYMAAIKCPSSSDGSH